MAEPQIVYPVDDWQRSTTGGVYQEFRSSWIYVGWASGDLMEKAEGFFLFSALPQELTRATLVLVPTQYLQVLPGDRVSIRAVGQEMGRDDQETPSPLSIDVTALLQGRGGDLLVELTPSPTEVGRNWLRAYGSVRGVEAARPRLVLEGAPLINPPPGEPDEGEAASPWTEMLNATLPLLVVGLMGTASLRLFKMARGKPKGR